jgi:hypothetical protein
MPKPIKQRKRPTNVNQIAQDVGKPSRQDLAADVVPFPVLSASLSEYMSAMGRKGGQIGGRRRMKTMTADERRKAAQVAARARWKKAK